jgi:hypothetical protein
VTQLPYRQLALCILFAPNSRKIGPPSRRPCFLEYIYICSASLVKASRQIKLYEHSKVV